MLPLHSRIENDKLLLIGKGYDVPLKYISTLSSLQERREEILKHKRKYYPQLY